VATVRWTADQILRRILPEGAEPLWRDPTGTVVLAEVTVHRDWIGTRVVDLEDRARTRAAYLNRMGEALVIASDTVIQDGDVLHVVAAENDMDRINKVLAAAPEEDH
jgi:trk system potassium uptake protein TrkA